MFNSKKSVSHLRVIKTARDENSINYLARCGFFPLLKRVERPDDIKSKYAILQNKKTGEIEVIGDCRSGGRGNDYEMVIGFTYYYPHNFASPFAAYLIPPDLKFGERVFIEDLIENYIGARWNQGDTYRLESCEAIWNGENLEIQYNSSCCTEFVG